MKVVEHWTYCTALCKICEKFPSASFLSPLTFTDGWWGLLPILAVLLAPLERCTFSFLLGPLERCTISFLLAPLQRCIVQTIPLANFLFLWSEWAFQLFHQQTFSSAQPNKGLQWVHKKTISIGASLSAQLNQSARGKTIALKMKNFFPFTSKQTTQMIIINQPFH